MMMLSNFHFHHIFHIYIEMHHSNISTYSIACFTNTYLPYSWHWQSPVHHGLEVGLPSRHVPYRQPSAEEYHQTIIKCDKNTQQATKTNNNTITLINKCFMKQTRHIHIYLHIQYERFAINNSTKKASIYFISTHRMIILSNFHFHHIFIFW